MLCHKADLLLGLQPGRGALEHGAVPVTVEGAFDAMAVTAAGDGHYVGVAPSGTALTTSLVQALDQAVPLADCGVLVTFDGDHRPARRRRDLPHPRRHRSLARPRHPPRRPDPASLDSAEP